MFNGYLAAKVGIPKLVVTLALFLAWRGVLQFALAGQPVNTSNYRVWARPDLRKPHPLWKWVFIIVVVSVGYTVLKSPSGRSGPRWLATA